MRKLLWVTLGFAIACGAWAYGLGGGAMWFAAGVTLAATAQGFWFLRGRSWSGRVLLVLLGISLGLFRCGAYDGYYLEDIRGMEGNTQELEITVTDYSWDGTYGIVADGKTRIQGKSYAIRFYSGEAPVLQPGDRVRGSFKLVLTTRDAQQGATHHQGKGILLLGYGRGEVQVERAKGWSLSRLPAWLRLELKNILTEAFPADCAGVARGLLLGDGTGIDYETDTAFKISGIRHIIAVSGLHVTILFTSVYVLTGKRRVLTTLLGLPVLFLFAAVAGFTPSVVRACIMNGLMMLAILFRREYDPPTALSFAVLAMLVMEPLVITSVGFQLSVGCMIGIFLFAGGIKNWLLDDQRLGHSTGKDLPSRLIRWLATSLGMSLGAVSITTPLSAYYFGTVSLVSPVTNLLTLSVVTVAFYGVMAVAVAGFLWLPLAQVLGWLVAWPIRYVMAVAKALSTFPLAAVYTQNRYVIWWLVGCYLLVAALRILPKKRPGLYAGIASVALVAALLAGWLPPMMEEMRMTVLDVGQGQSIILQCGRRTFLVDCGGDHSETAADTAAEALLAMGIRHIDGLILTHYDLDHAGGVPYLLTRIETDALYLPDWPDDIQSLSRREEAVAVGRDQVLELEKGKITIYTPETGDSDNERGLCILFQTENYDILITGDQTIEGEERLLKKASLPRLEVLVAGHHGSKNATGQALLGATDPAVAVISVGANNRYGHPTQETLDRLAAIGCQIFRTDRDGTIIIRG